MSFLRDFKRALNFIKSYRQFKKLYQTLDAMFHTISKPLGIHTPLFHISHNSPPLPLKILHCLGTTVMPRGSVKMVNRLKQTYSGGCASFF